MKSLIVVAFSTSSYDIVSGSVVPMKVVFLTRRFYPHIGGVEKHIYETSQKLMKRGYDVTVVAENHQLKAPKHVFETLDGIDAHYFNFGPQGPGKKFAIWKTLIQNRNLFQHADIIHTHDTMFWYAPLLFFVRKPVYATFHGDEKVFPPRKKAILIRKAGEFLAKKSIHVGSYLKKWYYAQPDEVTWGAVKKAYPFTPAKKNDKTKILLLGRLDKDISINVYKKTFDLLRAQKYPHIVDVCGDGTEKNSMKKYGTMHGFVDDVDPYIKNSDVVCASSYLAILESLSMYKPVVAVYEHPMKKDYLSMTPFSKWICITDDPEKAAAYIISKGAHGFTPDDKNDIKKLIEKSTWKNMADTYERLWQA